ncbi:FAD:protein FMN transferase [Lactovum miscens]|uniref:FAD:protein FMN transferase n=1 Tax=Lactovum miscens TaxID=190387 RepID=A0A841CAP5_9LACT|nr:FAD:protein FMN transferase [Lactovum miscens]MBB5888631.1 thiamine biosynthesis lipoprotein [Lactovum miscens]
MKKFKLPLAIGLFFGLTLVLSSCSSTSSSSSDGKLLKTPEISQVDTMGTTVKITDYTPNTKSPVTAALKIAQDYDTWVTVNQPGSVVDKINTNAGIAPVKVNSGVFNLIQGATDLSAQKTGFDVTVGPLTQLWHIGFDDAKKPSQAEINQVLPLINYKFIQLDKKNQTVYLTQKGAQLDLGSMTKGYVARLMADKLKAGGVKNAIVDLGSSSLYVMGHGPRGTNTEWNVGIKDPNNPDGEDIGLLSVQDQFVSTSGIYERFIEVDGIKYAHILNPETGYPFDNDIQSVTIVGKDNFSYGDGVTTAVFALGTKTGYDYVLKNKLQAIFIDKNNKIYVTPGLKNKFTVNSDSKYKIASISALKGNG